jgi:S-adenosylmethionine synthetase
VTQPALIDIKVTIDGAAISELEHQAKDIAERHLYRIPELIGDFVAGKIQIF